ncbi:MAG: peptide chain release factor N(5)-glutamine methyltransferase [Weeksellaceae bacterium]|nr:peptide chain release factor N(5)-glutamine methyltransferase [Weeksellaceae bacterium]
MSTNNLPPTLQELLQNYKTQLSDLYSTSEIDYIFFTLASKAFQKDKSILRTALNARWSDFAQKRLFLDSALFQLQSGTPYQYVVGETEFLGMRIFLNPSVLIPRPETEELAEKLIKQITKMHGSGFNGSVIDVCTGSGVLALAVKKAFPDARVIALDISEDALEVAKNNALYHHLHIEFLQQDFLSIDMSDMPYFDFIVSNPPYIPQSEKSEMSPVVVNHEPHQALFVEDQNPFIFYRQLYDLALASLRPKGKLWVEIHQDKHEALVKIYEEYFAQVIPHKDYSGNWRFLEISKPITC